MDLEPAKNEECFKLQPWKDEELYMVQPRGAVWPQSDPKISASKLKFDTYFTKSEVPAADLESFKTFIDAIPIPSLDVCVSQVVCKAFHDTQLAKQSLLEGKYYTLGVHTVNLLLAVFFLLWCSLF